MKLNQIRECNLKLNFFYFIILNRKDENYLRKQSPVYRVQKVKIEEVGLIGEELKYKLISKKIKNTHIEKVKKERKNENK